MDENFPTRFFAVEQVGSEIRLTLKCDGLEEAQDVYDSITSKMEAGCVDFHLLTAGKVIEAIA